MQLTIPTAIAALLPLFATMLSSWLNDDSFKPGINALIALIAILLTAGACELLAGNVTGDPAASFLAVLGYVGVLMTGDLSVLYQYLVAKPSPVSGPTPPANANPVRVPTALTLPPNATPVPPRASAQPPTTGQ